MLLLKGKGLSASSKLQLSKANKKTNSSNLNFTSNIRMNALQQNGLSGDMDSKREAWGSWIPNRY